MKPEITKNTNAPLPDLPNEVISQILEEFSPNPENQQPAWYVGHICPRWRDVALAMPTLWNFIVINLDQSEKAKRQSLEMTSEQFRRSGQSRITCMLYRTKRWVFASEHACRLLAHHASRIHHLIINGVESLMGLVFSSRPRLTLLETLEIISKHWIDSDYNILESITLFYDTPNLRRVVLSTNVYSHPEWRNQDFTSLYLPWAQLTHLRILGFQFATQSSIHALLTVCSNLEECSLSIPFDEPPQELPIITLPHLQTLDITNKGRGRHGQFLSCLTLPSLKCLVIPADLRSLQWSQRDLVELIGRSACQIEEFTLTGDPMPTFLLALLGEMPSLVRLAITEPAFLQHIIGPMIHDAFLPVLQRLECRVSQVDDTVAMLQATLGECAIGFNEPADGVFPCVVSLVTDSALGGEDDVVVRPGELRLGRLRFEVIQRNDLVSREAVDGSPFDGYSSFGDDADSEGGFDFEGDESS